MIQCIERLRNFGIYREFTGGAQSAVPPFKKRNLIYGWNYSGKTTLSRLFQSLQFPDRPLVHAGCSFTVKFADGTETSERQRSVPYPVRVFNRDFINANFREGHSTPAVFIVGEENVALRNRLEALQDAQVRLRRRLEERQLEIDRIQRDDSRAGTALATSVGQILGVRDFRRPDLEVRILEVRGNPTDHQMAEDRLKTTVDTFRSGEQFTKITPPRIALPDLITEIRIAREHLQRTASFDAIQGLNENRPLEDWLRTGLGHHNAAGRCNFCEGTLTPERLNLLQRHFSTASQQLLADVNGRIAHLQGLVFEPPRLDAANFLQEIRQRAGAELERIADWLQYAAHLRDSLIASLQLKRTSLESALEWTGPEDRLEEGVDVFRALLECISLHNERVGNIGGVMQLAREAIERHYAVVHFLDQDLATHELRIALLQYRNRWSEAAHARLGRMATNIAEQIDRAARGAERFMEIVSFLLRGSDIKVESRGESEFQLMRGTHPADKLSDGEVTAIAFAYFVTSLQGDDEDLANTIVYVDDPISSLDSNHVYAVYGLIFERLHGARQLFVSTHNSEFFSLLKGLWLSGREFPSDSEAYYVRRMQDTTGSFSQFESLPRLLRKYKSEYEFIFAQLHAFAVAPNPSDHEAYTAPNLLRRFLEAYLGFRMPCTAAWHAKLDMVLDSPEECREVHKLLDDASHLQSTGRALHEPAFAAIAQSCIQRVLSGLENKDPVHYNSLIAVVS